ncbi:MAG: DNA polymerase III subunit beta [wastewater metagenome]|nr:DNA polymerase III subunit beta [Candidatus Loosdrechtia aerotolerans]
MKVEKMNVSFTGNDLFRGFNLVTSIIPSSSVKNVLQGIKLMVQDQKVELTATDLEVLARYILPVKEYTNEGSIVLPAIRVNNILREWAGNDEVSISVGESNCTIRSKGGYFKIIGENPEQFPEVQANNIRDFIEIDSETISDMVGKVIYAVSTVKARSTLCGIFLRIDKDDINMVAADGNRLASVKRKVNNADDISVDGIVTAKCLSFLQRFASECKGTLKLGMSESQIRFISEKGEVISQLIDGKYPRYEEVIPKGNDKKAEVNKNELLSAVRMASFMTTEGYRVVKFVLKKGRLMLLSKTADVGETELEIPATYDGADVEICFNPDYVLDVLKVSDNESVVIELNDGDSAAIFRPDYEHVNVIMPVELKQGGDSL